jgi:hypothetical protein
LDQRHSSPEAAIGSVPQPVFVSGPLPQMESGRFRAAAQTSVR